MNKLQNTILEISMIFAKNNIEFVLTRFNNSSLKGPNDLDILVKPGSFKKAIKVLEENGYRSSSHDEALGGRIRGMQMNLTKPRGIKIDLHRDFTWRASRYFDLDLIWKNLKTERIGDVKYPTPEKAIDTFIIIINIIFEKTYLKKEDYNYIKKGLIRISRDPLFATQAVNYGWARTFLGFTKWFESVRCPRKWPVFLPVGLVFDSYFEKLLHENRISITSLFYNVFFRIRFFLGRMLPYN